MLLGKVVVSCTLHGKQRCAAARHRDGSVVVNYASSFHLLLEEVFKLTSVVEGGRGGRSQRDGWLQGAATPLERTPDMHAMPDTTFHLHTDHSSTQSPAAAAAPELNTRCVTCCGQQCAELLEVDGGECGREGAKLQGRWRLLLLLLLP